MDIRKRAIVPLGASLRGPGVVHDMHLRVGVDTHSLCILRVEPTMLAYPYVASSHTGGEHCAGRVGDVQSVVGTPLASSYVDTVRSLVGGSQGCFHIFTLLRLIGPAVVATLADERVRTRLRADSQPAVDEILWARSLTVDATKGEGLSLALHGTQTDTFQRGGPPENGGSEELVAGVEVMADMKTSFPSLDLSVSSGRKRELSPGYGNASAWSGVAEFDALRGFSVRKGFSARVHEVFDDEPERRPESHLAFMMAPVVMQSLPGFLEEMDSRPGQGGRESSAGAVGSCHMWRPGGPLDRTIHPHRSTS